ncbi:hypothetical protein SynWH8101_2071 [Synechococcus sp. WH 8101]|nr:hypothetical protein SynWH8101_2071 [Synechococcus sp. WH 8101]QNI45904.1 hypothetical protein SynRCC2555_02123 [Synechococcus sp. WH 8101]
MLGALNQSGRRDGDSAAVFQRSRITEDNRLSRLLSEAPHICSTSQARPQPTTREITPTIAFQKRGSLGWKTIGCLMQNSSSLRWRIRPVSMA